MVTNTTASISSILSHAPLSQYTFKNCCSCLLQFLGVAPPFQFDTTWCQYSKDATGSKKLGTPESGIFWIMWVRCEAVHTDGEASPVSFNGACSPLSGCNVASVATIVQLKEKEKRSSSFQMVIPKYEWQQYHSLVLSKPTHFPPWVSEEHWKTVSWQWGGCHCIICQK